MPLPNRRDRKPLFRSTLPILIGLTGAMSLATTAIAAGPADGTDANPTPVGSASPSATSAQAPTSPTDAIQALLDAHQYSAAVRQASRQLGTDSDFPESNPNFDRFRMLMLKGEALLGMHESYMAVDQFQSATRASKDPRDIALATCAIDLIRHSTGGDYVPRFAPPDSPAGTAKPPPIPLAGVNLLDPDARRPLFNAMLDDQLTALQPRIREATSANNLPTIYRVLEQVEKLAQLDTVANGDATKTANIAGGFLDHVHTMLSSALKQMWSRLNDIEQYANQVTNYSTGFAPTAVGTVGANYTTAGIIRRNGLSQANKTELTDMISTCGKIHQAADAFGKIAQKVDASTPDATAALGQPIGPGTPSSSTSGTSNNAVSPGATAAATANPGAAPAGGNSTGATAPGGSTSTFPTGPANSANSPTLPAGLAAPPASDWASLGSDADRLAGHAKDILDTNFDTGSTAYSTQTNDPYGATTGATQGYGPNVGGYNPATGTNYSGNGTTAGSSSGSRTPSGTVTHH